MLSPARMRPRTTGVAVAGRGTAMSAAVMMCCDGTNRRVRVGEPSGSDRGDMLAESRPWMCMHAQA